MLITIILFIIGLILFISIIALIKGLILSRHNFTCHNCNKEFKPKWYQVMYEFHAFNKFRIRCPYCNKKGLNKII